ncbi:membrane protein [Caballeronia sordidicola]|uniref:Membrane protein n=1 Tax=Caballeronia sordidicola TaxID=196367 RepID=A0A158GQ61_CABSO|nr:O-antigen ligase family protein [Caballeronia sordidicola]SAL33749.1 membrane protein [Caballeronia sordidicola]
MVNLRLKSWAGDALSTVCAVLLFVVMFDHMTAVKYIGLGVLIAILALLAFNSLRDKASRRLLPAQPLLIALSAWALWTLMSAAWSFDRALSLGAWRDEVFYPLAGFFGFWLIGKEALNKRRLQTVVWVACLILAIASVVFFNDLDPAIPKPGLLHFYARVGHTSTLALMAIPLFASMISDPNTRFRGLTGIAFCVVIGGATLNRFFWIALAVVAVVLLWPRSPHDRLRAWTALGTLLVATLAAVGFSNKLRLMDLRANAATANSAQALSVPPVSALRVTASTSDRPTSLPHSAHVLAGSSIASSVNRAMSSDARPRIWAFYLSQVPAHPWLGVGFGKPLPSLAYESVIPDDLVKLDGNVRTHAHNIFLNTLLQVGAIGLLIQLAVFTCLANQFFAIRHAYPQLFRAGFALILGMLAKNLTDDFMWQSTMLMFWSYSGWLLGQTAVRLNALKATTPFYQAPRSAREITLVERPLEPASS